MLRDVKEELRLLHFKLQSCRAYPLKFETANVFMIFNSNGISMFSLFIRKVRKSRTVDVGLARWLMKFWGWNKMPKFGRKFCSHKCNIWKQTFSKLQFFFLFSEMSFHCLGDWEAPNGQRYVALMDTQATSQNGDDPRPRYRCAVSLLITTDSLKQQHQWNATKQFHFWIHDKVFEHFNCTLISGKSF